MADEKGPKLTSTKARAGAISGRVITILLISFVLAIVLVGGAALYWSLTH